MSEKRYSELCASVAKEVLAKTVRGNSFLRAGAEITRCSEELRLLAASFDVQEELKNFKEGLKND